MTIEAKVTPANPAPPETPATPPPASPPTPPTSLAKEQGAPPSPPAPPPSPETPKVVTNQPTHRLLRDDDDELPTDAELIAMPAKSLKGRLDRFTKKQLRERFGVEDFDAIKTQLDELNAYKAREEEQRLAQMTEMDRLKEQLTASDERANAAERRFEEAQEARMMETEDRRVTNILEKHLDSDYIEEEIPRLARYLATLPEGELSDATIEGWAKERVEKKPKLGKDFGVTAPPPPRTVPLTNGAAPDRPVHTTASSLVQKTAAPGKNNSMTETEVREYKKAHGLNW